ncbi:TPA: helix-turn-helix domain-containing protein, partial [Campylobacter lari]|nr:helix-turn-helix domain-containing protein [Campylobacter lari]
ENASNNTLKITHEALANHLGSAREAVSRILKELEKEGKIKLERSKIILISL